MESDGRKRELGIQEALELTQNIINTVHESVLILYEDLKVALANENFYRTFKVSPEETEDRLIFELGNGQWNIPKLRFLLEDILPNMTSFDHYEIAHEFPAIGKRVMSLNARRIYINANRTKLIVVTIKDITLAKK